MKQQALFLAVLALSVLVSCDRSCDGLNPDMRECKMGCTDPEALNFDPEADIGNNSCNYFNPPATITFSVPDGVGGPVYIVAESSTIGAYRKEHISITDYGTKECGMADSNSVRFGRNFQAEMDRDWVIKYTAHDTTGWYHSGNLVITDGACYVVNIPREHPGRVLFYTIDFSAVIVTITNSNQFFDPEEYASGYSNTSLVPSNCDAEYTFELHAGSYTWTARENGTDSLDQYTGTVTVLSDGCTIVSLKD